VAVHWLFLPYWGNRQVTSKAQGEADRSPSWMGFGRLFQLAWLRSRATTRYLLLPTRFSCSLRQKSLTDLPLPFGGTGRFFPMCQRTTIRVPFHSIYCHLQNNPVPQDYHHPKGPFPVWADLGSFFIQLLLAYSTGIATNLWKQGGIGWDG
jgi:hypothetical protein